MYGLLAFRDGDREQHTALIVRLREATLKGWDASAVSWPWTVLLPLYSGIEGLIYLLTKSQIFDSQIHMVDGAFIMSLRKPPTLTPARIAANRRNARKSTGPRTAQGKARSRLNGLRDGWRSPTYRALFRALAYAPPCSVNRVVAAHKLTPEEASHPVFCSMVDMFRRVERDIFAGFFPGREPLRKKRF